MQQMMEQILLSLVLQVSPEVDSSTGEVITEPKPEFPKKTTWKFLIESSGGEAGYGVSKIRILGFRLQTDGTDDALCYL